MSNPLFNGGALGNGTPNNNALMQSIANDLNYLRRFQNPAQFWAALEKENPQAAQTLRKLQQTMQNPMQVAMQELNSRGIDINQIMAMLR